MLQTHYSAKPWSYRHRYLITEALQIGYTLHFWGGFHFNYKWSQSIHLVIGSEIAYVRSYISGVPQEMHFFILFINDVGGHFKHAWCLMYLDDPQPFRSIADT